MNIESPFLKEISACKVMMRKMRKKISKHFSIARDFKKGKEQNHDILNILKSRNLPNYVIDPLKKRRTFDLNFLKSLTVSSVASLDDVIQMTCNQENEIQSLFAEHKLRMKKTPRRIESFRTNKKETIYVTEFGESEEFSVASIESSSKEELEIPCEFEDNHFTNEKELFLGQGFYSLGEELESEEERWFRF